MKRLVLFLSVMFVFIYAAQAYSEKEPASKGEETEEDSITVKSDGVGTLKEDATAARKIAINDALRVAVEQSKGVLIKGETEVRDYAELRDEVVSKTKGFVKTYKILNESTEGNIYKVTLEVEVMLADPKAEAPVKLDEQKYKEKIPRLIAEARILFEKTDRLAESLRGKKKDISPEDAKRLHKRYVMMLQILKSIEPPGDKREKGLAVLKAVRLKAVATNIFTRFIAGERRPRMLEKGFRLNQEANGLIKGLKET